jgi:hypothetical protein
MNGVIESRENEKIKGQRYSILEDYETTFIEKLNNELKSCR